MVFGLDLAIFGSICVAELRMSVGFSTSMCSEMAWNLEKPDVEKNKNLLDEVILRYRFHHGNKGFARIFFLDLLALRQLSFLLSQASPTQERVIHTQRNPNPHQLQVCIFLTESELIQILRINNELVTMVNLGT